MPAWNLPLFSILVNVVHVGKLVDALVVLLCEEELAVLRKVWILNYELALVAIEVLFIAICFLQSLEQELPYPTTCSHNFQSSFPFQYRLLMMIVLISARFLVASVFR